MRTLILSDIHANLTALEAVLEDAGDVERVWCLGDIVGYGPDPNECIERVSLLPGLRCIKGNHDAAILGEIAVRTFNHEARASLSWLETVLTPSNRRWLKELDEQIEIEGVTLAHGSPRDTIWEYILDVGTAQVNMGYFSTQVCLVGHTHLPAMFQMAEGNTPTPWYNPLQEGEPFQITQKCIINPGSVGQPRDHDPRAAYMLFDDALDVWTFKRVKYDVKQVQERILVAGLPERHALRLRDGW